MYRDLPSRHTIRLSGYNYSSPNWYYITICTHERLCIFGNLVGARRGSPIMQLNQYGHIAQDLWESISQHHMVKLDIFQIMPNHVHGIIVINHTGEPRLAPTLGKLIGYFKSECTKQMRKLTGDQDFILWQRNYYEHIIRDEEELEHVRQYIADNPRNWKQDELFS